VITGYASGISNKGALAGVKIYGGAGIEDICVTAGWDEAITGDAAVYPVHLRTVKIIL